TDTPAERCLTIRTEVEANAGMIWVIDNGPGVSPELRDKLFQPFFTTKHTGLGMGLSICQSILESLGGRIDLKNHNGRGAEFCVALPLA
ncbi:MAG: ATP-binding protein, partial [Candidatus Korobacteraceae bacterium]